MKVVIPDPIELNKHHLDEIRKLGDVKIYDDMPKTDEEMIKRVKDAEVITANWVVLTPKIINSAAKLKYIVAPAAGYDYIDTSYAAKKGIKVLNCPTQNSDAVANLAITFMLMLMRNLKAANLSISSGKWHRDPFKGDEPKNKILGLIGYGNIGKRIEKIARFIGMSVKHTNSKSSENQLDHVIKNSDVIVLCLSLNKKTKHLFNKRRIGMMKRNAYLINISRGAIVDQKALIRALKSKRIAGAGLDVFENEPWSTNTKEINKEILTLSKMENVIVSPHIAYNTNNTVERLGEELIKDIKSCLNGKPINVVN